MATKLDTCWEKIDSHLHFVDALKKCDFFEISADQIKQFGLREPRLVTKFDTKLQQPKLFVDNELSILPINRGNYVVAKMNLFSDLVENDNIETDTVIIPEELSSLNLSTITSEALALSAAGASGVFNDFLGEEELHTTVCGRMGSGTFDFQVKNLKGQPLSVRVANSQEEIDGSQECRKFLALIEAKNHIFPDFIIRQLYYPMRTWKQILPNKHIRNIYMQYSDGTFYLREYVFDDVNEYNSIRLHKEKKYLIVERDRKKITAKLLFQIANNIQVEQAPMGIPFPQCDDFRRIIYLCELFWEDVNKEWTKEDLFQNLSFGSIDPRQVDYYLNGALFIGVISRRIDNRVAYYQLSDFGRQIMICTTHNERSLKFIESICKNEIFNRVLKHSIERGVLLNRQDIIPIMREYNLFERDAMYERRSSTVRRWVFWCLLQIEG